MRINQIEIYRNRILDVCKKLIDDETFFEKSLFEIARLAKVSRMTIYRHFSNKNEIIKNLLNNDDLENLFEDFSCDSSFYKIFLIRNQHLFRNNVLMFLVKNNRIDLINDSLKEQNDSIINKILSCKNINNISFKFIQGGYHKSLMMWIKSQWSRSPESVAYELEKVILSLM